MHPCKHRSHFLKMTLSAAVAANMPIYNKYSAGEICFGLGFFVCLCFADVESVPVSD